MYYPSNFPIRLEGPLIGLLLALEKDFKINPPSDEKSFNRLVMDRLKKPDLQKHFMDKKPSLWWFNFILLRHGNRFTQQFRDRIKQFLMKTRTRSISGIVALSLFTKGTGCPFNCIYCPNEPGVPKSYFSDEPAVMRAIRHNFDPYAQTLQRLVMFALSGHPLDKVEIIIKGGTFSFYPKMYRKWFVKRIFEAVNTDVLRYIETGKLKKIPSVNLSGSQKYNETSISRIIGINIETRPDYINKGEISFLRGLGVTQVEIGVQALDDNIYGLIKRGHTVKDVVRATYLLKEAGFKVGYHLMPNLPGSSPSRDLALLKKVFEDTDFKPDHLKLYPTTVTRGSTLSRWQTSGLYRPYPVSRLIRTLIEFKSEIAPLWLRIGRLTRDITTTVMEGEGIAPNLREILQKEMQSKNLDCSCIRCREIRDRKIEGTPQLRIITYQASGAIEHFLEYIDLQNRSLGFLRLRLPARSKSWRSQPTGTLKGKAVVRELHVYGQAVPIGKKDGDKIQHQSIGKSLLAEAEKITAENNLSAVAVIAGVGTREYYRKHGYILEGTYMVKSHL